MKQEINIKYEFYDSIRLDDRFPDELSPYEKVVKAAIDARSLSYSPYSNFHVGAAIEMSDGTIYKGANQEVSAFPSCLCAERVALAKAQDKSTTTHIKFIAITASTQDGNQLLTSPCGSCRQALLEARSRQENDFKVILYAEDKGLYIIEKVIDLLPFGFIGDFLK